MRSVRTVTLFLTVLTSCAFGAESQEIKIWPDGVPSPEVPTDPAEELVTATDGLTRRFNVSQPRLFVHLPEANMKRTGAAVIIVPGGGFGRLADEHEGTDIAKWLNQHGIVAFQLAYRTPTNKQPEPHVGPVQDLHKSITIVRSRAAEFGVDPKKIGVIGFSAGGQTSIVAATTIPTYAGAETGISTKPDFLMLVYPYRLYDPTTKGLRTDFKLDAGLPPTFIAQASDDNSSPPQGALLLYAELIARKIPAELHVYERGGHGFGMRARPNTSGPTDWSKRAADWLALREYVAKD